MTILNLIIKHKLFALNDFWKYQHLTFKIHNGSITLSLYTKDYKNTCELQYSVDNGRNWNNVIKVEKKSAINDNECKAKYTIGTFDNSVKLRGNVLIENSNQWGVFSVKCNNGATYDVCGNPASLYSSDSFASVRTIDLSNLFANKVKISDDELYYDDNKLSWKDSGENLIFTKESSNIKYGGESVYGDNGLLSIKNLWLLHPNGTYTNMFIGSNVKTITDYMPISGRCGGMFYSSQITSDDLKLLLPSIQNYLYEGMFAYCPNIKNITVNNIQNKDIYAGMFLGCKNLEKINVTYSNITSSLSKTIKSMFFECSKINLFNITFDNISVPEFDEYFRFTIPSTLTDCSESELSINSISTNNPTWKVFKNSSIVHTPVINNIEYLSLDNIFNFENIEFISKFDYESDMKKLEFSNNLKLIDLTKISDLTINCTGFFSSFINNLLSPTLIVNDLYLYKFENHNTIFGNIGPLEIDPNHGVSTYHNVPRFSSIYNNCNDFEDCENINLEDYFFCSGVKTKSDFEIKFNFDITTIPSVDKLYFLFSDFKKNLGKVLSLFSYILNGTSFWDTGLFVFGNIPNHTSSYKSFLDASTIHLIKRNNLISIRVDDNLILNNYQLDNSYEDTLVYIGGISKICNFIEVNNNKFTPIKLNNNILAMKDSNDIYYPLFPISRLAFG